MNEYIEFLRKELEKLITELEKLHPITQRRQCLMLLTEFDRVEKFINYLENELLIVANGEYFALREEGKQIEEIVEILNLKDMESLICEYHYIIGVDSIPTSWLEKLYIEFD